jgi:cyclophilin family peptidyl-prolyl cis-trans isomerase
MAEGGVLGFAAVQITFGGMNLKRFFFGALMVALAACGQRSETTTTTQGETATSGTAVTETSTTTAPVTDTAVMTDTSATGTTTTTTTTTGTTTSTPPAHAAKQENKKMNPYENKVAELHTTAGEIDIRFFPDVAPNHVKNFIDLAQKGFYTNTKFHRIIQGFMIQGGDPNTISGDPSGWGTGGSKENVKAEFNSVSHKRGIVSMARSTDPNSASSQFFIVVKDSTFLDKNYTVFGQVTKGMDVADKIVGAKTVGNDRPAEPVAITSIVVRDAREDEKGPTPK